MIVTKLVYFDVEIVVVSGGVVCNFGDQFGEFMILFWVVVFFE